MPYVKDGIGVTPRYVYKDTSRWYHLEKCNFVAKSLKSLGIPYQMKTYKGTCAVFFNDSYEAYVDNISPQKYRMPFFN